MTSKNFLDDLRLASAQQPVIDEDAGQLAANRLVQKGRRHTPIHAAAQAEEDPLLPSDPANFLDRLVEIIAHVPIRPATANAMDKIGDNLAPARRMGDLGMKLQPIKAPFPILQSRELRIIRSGGDLEALGNLAQLIPVRIPDLERTRQLGKERTTFIDNR